MGGNEIFSAIRKTSLRHLMLPVFSVIAAMCIYSFISFDDVFNPRQAYGSQEAVDLYNKGYEYAYIHVEKLYYTGFDIMSGDESEASYYYEMTDNKCTFYILSSDVVKDKPLELNNIWVKVKMDKKDGLMENMITSFSGNLGWTSDGMLSVTNNIVMNQEGYHFERYIVVYICLMAVIVYSMVLVTVNVLFIAVPFVHPVMIRYYWSGNLSVKKAVKELMEDFRNNKVMEAGDMYITENYFYNLGINEVSVIPLNKIVMGYEHGRLRSFFGIHLKITQTLYFIGLSGRKILASGKSATDVTDITNYLSEKYPHIIWGHTKENKQLAKDIIKEYRKKQRLIKKEKRNSKKSQ